jgi:uncharacterized protein
MGALGSSKAKQDLTAGHVTETTRVMLNRTVPRFVLFCAALALCNAPSLSAQPQAKTPAAKAQPEIIQNYEPHPAIWKLADADTTIYLFGTTHVLPPSFRWRSVALNTIIDQADELVLETTESPEEVKATETLMAQLLSPDQNRIPLLDRIAPEKRVALRTVAIKASMPLSFFDKLPTWMATFGLIMDDMSQNGSDGEHGVEAVLRDAFAKGGKPVSAVEDGNAILRELNQMPEAAQVKMLEDAVGDMDDPAIDGPNDDAWAKGEVTALDAEFTDTEFGPELYEILVRRRNIAWVNWLSKRLEKPGTVLFAVGAGHLAGPDSLQKMLAAKGLTADRID